MRKTKQPEGPPERVEIPAIRDANRCLAHPGEVLNGIFDEIGRPRAKIAAALGISRQHLYDLTSARKPLSPEMAVRIGKLLGNGGCVWLRMQAAHDLWKAEHEIDVSKIPTLAA